MSVLFSLSVSELLSVSSELESMSELSEESCSMTTSASIRGAFAGGLAALFVSQREKHLAGIFDNALFFFWCP